MGCYSKSRRAELREHKRKRDLDKRRLELYPQMVEALTEFERIHFVMTDEHEHEEEALLFNHVTPLLREIAALNREEHPHE